MRLISMRTMAAGLVAGVAAVAFATGGMAQDEKSPVQKYRSSVMGGMGAHMGALAAIVQGQVPFSGHVAGHAAAVAALAEMIPDAFPEGSGDGTRAKPEIWQNWADFTAKYEALEAAADNLVEVAAAGDMAAIGTAFGAVGGACGACHDMYRAPAP